MPSCRRTRSILLRVAIGSRFLPRDEEYVLDAHHRVKCAYDACVRLLDSHAHLQDPRLGTGAIRSGMLRRARSAGVEVIVIPAVSPQDWDSFNMQFNAYRKKDHMPRLYFALGIHPYALPDGAAKADDQALDRLVRQISNAGPDVVAIGECGLDYSLSVPRERQQRVLISQIQLASRTGFPLILHCVRAHDDLLSLLSKHGAPPSVLHGFTGSPETAERWTRAGHYVSLGGMVTNPRARRIRAAAKRIEDSRLLVESDAPDQTPAARRPATNEPAFLRDVVQSIAELRGQSADAIAALTWSNALRLFRLSP